MHTHHLADNLRLLCSYVGNISQCCKKIGINRQQFTKYLNGQSQPSMPSLRKICDYFGVDSDEIFLEPSLFASLLSTKQHAPFPFEPLAASPIGKRYQKQLQSMVDHSAAELERYAGDYYYYYMTPSYDGFVSKGFARIRVDNGIGHSHFYERAEPSQAMLDHAEIGKFVGIVLLLGERLQIIDYSVHCQRAVSQTILYGATKGQIDLLSGLTMGIQGTSSRIPFTSRVVFERLGHSTSLREKLKGVGLFAIDEGRLPKPIMDRLQSASNIRNPHIFTAVENYS